MTGERPACRPVGCEACRHTGYAGRLPIIEYMEVSSDMRKALLQGTKNIDDLAAANKGHLRWMSQSASQWIVSGGTTPLEVQRVLGIRFWTELSRQHQVALGPVATYQEQTGSGSEPLRVMLLSGDNALADRLAEVLPYPVERVPGEMQASERLRAEPNVMGLLIDASSLESPPADWLAQLRAQLAWSGLPVLFLVPEKNVAMQQLLGSLKAPCVVSDASATGKIASALDALLTGH